MVSFIYKCSTFVTVLAVAHPGNDHLYRQLPAQLPAPVTVNLAGAKVKIFNHFPANKYLPKKLYFQDV